MTLPLSDHFNGKTFFQSHHAHSGRHRDLLRWQFTARRKRWPARVNVAPQPPPPLPQRGEVVVTWIGHATFLLQTTQGNFLTDPVFSERVSPFSWAGPRRTQPPGVELAALPPIAGVLLSHDHYDHCDLPSLRELAAAQDPLFLAPLRHRDLLEQVGARRIVELDWWESHVTPAGVELTLTPTKHWSNRFGSPRNHRLWGGFYLKIGPRANRPDRDGSNSDVHRVWFVGDTGYDGNMFEAIAACCERPDVALVPIGAYEPRWFMAPMHMNPAEAVQLHRDVAATTSIAMHWGTFQLTDEGREEPVEALAAARLAAGLTASEFRVLAPGESLIL